MSDIAISVEQLSKLYRLGSLRSYDRRLTDRLFGRFSQATRRLGAPDGNHGAGQPLPANQMNGRAPVPQSSAPDSIWAIKDVTFDVKWGEVVGIIGRNGAGKSTLLKILSRITSPTQGRATICGRLGSLLEVGTGFHPELTGRENVFLNGAILGMSTGDVKRKFDEIVEFSGVQKFLDTPVKRYSSGMYVRLAFAVAAHLEPEILLVDEVLAVGDFEFQRKCLGKMASVAREGRTVLFVSHNIGAVLRLVGRCILLKQGQVAIDGNPREVVDTYLGLDSPDDSGEMLFPDEPARDTQVLRIAIRHPKGHCTSVLDPADDMTVDVDFVVRETSGDRVDVLVVLGMADGTSLASFNTAETEAAPRKWPIGRHRLTVTFPGGILNSGRYLVRAVMTKDRKAYHNHPSWGPAVHVDLTEASLTGSSGYGMAPKECLLAIRPRHEVKLGSMTDSGASR